MCGALAGIDERIAAVGSRLEDVSAEIGAGRSGAREPQTGEAGAAQGTVTRGGTPEQLGRRRSHALSQRGSR